MAVVHAVGVALEVAELCVQFFGLSAGQRALPGGGDDRLDVPGVELGVAVFEPPVRVGGNEGQVPGEVGPVLTGVPDVGDVGDVRRAKPGSPTACLLHARSPPPSEH
jgi:hypothetical protein